MRARADEYLIETKMGRFSRSTVWTSDHKMDLDLPRGWRIEKDGERLFFRDYADPERAIYELTDFDDGETRVVRLPTSRVGRLNRPLVVSLRKLRAPRPVYTNNPSPSALHTQKPRQLCAFYGQRYFLIHYRPVGPVHSVQVGPSPVISYQKTAQGFVINAHTFPLQINVGGHKHFLPPSRRLELSDLDFFRATVVYGIHWWRFRMVPTPDGQPPLDSDETDEDLREALRFQYSTVGFLGAVAAVLFSAYLIARMSPPAPKIVKAEVTLQKPKEFPKFEEKKPIPPPPEKIAEVKPPEPEPPKPKPEPPKPKKEKPLPVAKVKPKKEPPRKVAATKPAPKPKPAPEPAAQTPITPPEPQIAKDPGPTPDQLRAIEKAEMQAAEKAQMLKSLNFLSTSKSRPAVEATTYESKEGKYAESAKAGGLTAKSNLLDKVVKGAPGDGAITTKSGRNIASKLSFGKGKALNDVQGKVTAGELTSKDGSIGNALGGGKGLDLSGPGSLTESQIEKALSAFLKRFQYCYEKSLMSDSSLTGNLVVQWTINAGGRASNSRVVKSQLNNGDLHACVLKILGEVPFPKPKGGEVIVKKTFTFSSSSM